MSSPRRCRRDDVLGRCGEPVRLPARRGRAGADRDRRRRLLGDGARARCDVRARRGRSRAGGVGGAGLAAANSRVASGEVAGEAARGAPAEAPRRAGAPTGQAARSGPAAATERRSSASSSSAGAARCRRWSRVGARGHAHRRAAEVVVLRVRAAHEDRRQPALRAREPAGARGVLAARPSRSIAPPIGVRAGGDEVELRAQPVGRDDAVGVRRGDEAAPRGRSSVPAARSMPTCARGRAPSPLPCSGRRRSHGCCGDGPAATSSSRRCTRRARAGPRRPGRIDARVCVASAARQAPIVSCSSRAGTTMQASSGTKPTVAVTSPPRRRCASAPALVVLVAIVGEDADEARRPCGTRP